MKPIQARVESVDQPEWLVVNKKLLLSLTALFCLENPPPAAGPLSGYSMLCPTSEADSPKFYEILNPGRTDSNEHSHWPAIVAEGTEVG